MKHLGIQKFSQSGLEDFESLIEECSTPLESLRVVIIPEHPFQIADTGLPTRAMDLSPIVIRKSLKKIHASMVVYNDNTLIYIMHKYPNLDYLHINCGDCGGFLAHQSKFVDGAGNKKRMFFSPIAVSSFISFASQIPSHDIQLPLPGSILHEALSMRWNLLSISISYEDQSSIFYQLAKLDNHRPATLHLSTGTSTDAQQVDVAYNDRDSGQHPHNLLIQACGQNIHTLSVATNATGRPLDTASQAFELDQVFENCTNLRQLTLTRSVFSIQRLKDSSTNHSITHLTLKNVVIMNRDELEEVSQKLPSLKNLVIHD